MTTKKNKPVPAKAGKTTNKTNVPTKKPDNPILPSQDLTKPSITISDVSCKSFFIERVVGVKIDVDDKTGEPDRYIHAVNVMADKDLSNEPIVRKKLVDSIARKMYDDGYSFSDESAIGDAYWVVEKNLGQLRQDIEYSHACKKCTMDKIEILRKLMKLAREIHDTRDALSKRVKSVPAVIPCDLDNISIKDDAVVDKLGTGKDEVKNGICVEIHGCPSKDDIDKAVSEFFSQKQKPLAPAK